MNVLHVITGLNNGGAEAVLFRLIENDKGSGYLHFVVSLTDRGIYSERLEAVGAKVYALNFPRGKIVFSGLIKLYQIFRQIKPDVVQTWMYHADLIGGLIARFSGIRAVAWGIRHANLDPQHNSRTTLAIARLCMYLSRWVPKIIVSCSLQATAVHQAMGYCFDKFVYIPNGYNMARFDVDLVGRASLRAEIGLADDVFVIGMVARFDPQKDHRNLLDALGQLKRCGIQFSCLLVGVGMSEENDVLRAWIREAGIADRIILMGPRADIPAVMNAIDVHVLSSLGEAFPNVLAEAMACGTPCVTTDVGDAAVIVRDHGWVVVPQDRNALAAGLEKAHFSFSRGGLKWQEQKLACRAHIMNNFELNIMCERYHDIWKSCVEQ
ncbi:glycosyltransferase [Variovorax sp. UMC13]|uniref:glycosyltransferase family 4 protein n=1 Tax=Variovorax sp. UMC13 TaxID=1862326 RepID=UPI0016044801|nr:glycosyltransferase [Variovorax sp. UMC13]MBB1603854.1 hypothetical protein [Variovorax sp. UMC13]